MVTKSTSKICCRSPIVNHGLTKSSRLNIASCCTKSGQKTSIAQTLKPTPGLWAVKLRNLLWLNLCNRCPGSCKMATNLPYHNRAFGSRGLSGLNRAPSHQPKSHPRRGHASPGNPARGLPVSHRPCLAHPQTANARGAAYAPYHRRPPRLGQPAPPAMPPPTLDAKPTRAACGRFLPAPPATARHAPSGKIVSPQPPRGRVRLRRRGLSGGQPANPTRTARSLTAAISRTENASTGAVRGFLALLRGGFSPSCVGGGRGEALPQLRRWWRVGRRAVRVGFRNGQPCRHRLLHRVPGAALALAPRCLQRQHRVSLPYQ